MTGDNLSHPTGTSDKLSVAANTLAKHDLQDWWLSENLA
jgi:hypothetical protein